MSVKMKNYLLGIVLSGLMLWGGTAYAEKDYVIARLGDIEITVFELQRETQRILPFNKSFHGGVSADRLKVIRKMAFERLVEQAYKVHYALTHEIAVPASRLEERIGRVQEKFGGQEGLQKALGDESFSAFKASVYRLLVAEQAEEVAVNSHAAVSEEDLKTFYQENTFMYQRPRQYRASHILVKVDPSLVGEERQKLLARAENLAKKAKNGEDFYNLAYYNSDEDTKYVGGDIGYFHAGQTVKEFLDAVKDLSPGDIVGPVETISGFHIIKLTDVQEARLLRFDEVEGQIRKTLEDKKREQLYNDWMAGLKKQVSVDVLHPELKS